VRLDAQFPPNRVAAAAVAAQLVPFVDRPRFLAIVFGWLAAVAVLFAVVGTYAVSRLETSRRVRDLAVHLALGASAIRLYRLALGRTMGATAVGVLAGLVAARAAVSAAPYVLDRTTAASPAPYGLAALLMVAASLLAVWPQARRIVRMTPASADRFGASGTV
jgi:ABC-type antimicrobial peptide transport system permease subunit